MSDKVDELFEATMLTAAGKKTVSEFLGLINSGADINSKDDEGGSVLMRALSFHGSFEFIRELINLGADVNARDNEGSTVLMRSIMCRNRPEIIRVLVKSGADVNAKFEKTGTTVLMFAAMFLNAEIVNFLIDAGADTKPKDKSFFFGHTAKYYAKSNKNPQNAQAIIQILDRK